MPCTRPSRQRRTLGAVCAALPLLAAALPAPAAVSDYVVEKLVFEGDPDPLSGTISMIFSEADIAGGRVVAWGNQSDGEARLYLVDEGTTSIFAMEGDTAPDTGGDVFTDVGRPRTGGNGILAYFGIFSGQGGIFLRSGALDQALALPGDALPGGGTVAGAGAVHSAAPGPWIAFSVLASPGSTPVHLAYGAPGLREIHRDGGSAPAGVGGVFSGVQAFHEAAIGPDGAVTFAAQVSGGSAGGGLFRAPVAGPTVALLLAGDTVTTAGGGSFEAFGSGVSVNHAGDVAFYAEVLRSPPGFAQEAVFALESGVQREIVIRGDPVAGASVAPLFGGLAGSAPPAIDALGLVVFAASLEDAGQTQSRRAVLGDDGSGPEVLVEEGDAVPGVPGAAFTDFSDVRIDEAGRIAILAHTTQGTGVFLASLPSQVPALPAWGLALALALLAGAGGGLARRR